MGGTYGQVAYAVQNMIANLTGMICDGAKPSCALKVTTGVSTAVPVSYTHLDSPKLVRRRMLPNELNIIFCFNGLCIRFIHAKSFE